MDGAIREEVIQCLRRNVDVFAWTPQDLEGISPEVITHHLNIGPRIKPLKQKKRHFDPEKDRIIQAKIDKLVAAGHVEKYNSPNGYLISFSYLNPAKNGECASILKTSTRLVLKTFTPYPE
ncbi:UNVERIFIED_CONTAM: hypothetical protein Slati_3864300 [Sesamum latifolium]|uniref:Reverse transcriptase domain-containing protein n=1 Tax=Sesamum latifolium TaxID=2727402 RepID=A0AAW2TLK7_9LAMI